MTVKITNISILAVTTAININNTLIHGYNRDMILLSNGKGVCFMITRERYMRQIRPFINTDLIKVLTGLRRCGKSVMLTLIQAELLAHQVPPQNLISLNFEDLDSVALRDSEKLHRYLLERIKPLKGRAYIFLDEIQEVLEWEKCVNSLRVKCDADIYVTGSNANLLSGEFATVLGGRYVAFIIHPFCLAEFLEALAQREPGIEASAAFTRYLTLGGMPFLSNLHSSREASQQYLRDIYDSVVLKDVVSRCNIRDVDLLSRIINYVIANVGKTFSATSISAFLKSEKRSTTPETVLNYIKACQSAYFFYKIPRQDLQEGKRILSVGEKYYLADHGIREALYGKNMRDIELVLENIVCMELLSRGYNVTVGKIGQAEIDFVAEKQGEPLYIQVSYLLAEEKTIDREFGSLAAVKDNYPKLVLSMDDIDLSRDGIRHMHVRDFLLQANDTV